MHYKLHFHVILLCIFVMNVCIIDAIPCDSCGNECASACGTKHFRTCCFNYLRKRTDPNALKLISNKRLIDFMMLQGRAMFTENQLSREEAEEEAQQQEAALQQQQQRYAKQQLKAYVQQQRQNNGTLIDVGLQRYYG